MKVIHSLFFPVYFALLSPLFAQSSPTMEHRGFEVKFSGGLNRARLTHDNTISFFGPYDNAAAFFSGGVSVVYVHNARYNVEVGIRYTYAGARTEKQTGTDENGRELGKFWFVQQLQFIEVPILFIYQFDERIITPYLFIGPNVAYLVDGEEKLASDYGENPWGADLKEKLNTLTIAAEVGIGVKYQIHERFSVGLSSFYMYGLSNQVKKEYGGEQQTRDLRLFASMQIYIGK